MDNENEQITLACPKCGADVTNIKSQISKNGLLHYVVCDQCKAFVVEDTAKKAVEQWNRGHAAPGIGG